MNNLKSGMHYITGQISNAITSLELGLALLYDDLSLLTNLNMKIGVSGCSFGFDSHKIIDLQSQNVVIRGDCLKVIFVNPKKNNLG